MWIKPVILEHVDSDTRHFVDIFKISEDESVVIANLRMLNMRWHYWTNEKENEKLLKKIIAMDDKLIWECYKPIHLKYGLVLKAQEQMCRLSGQHLCKLLTLLYIF